MTSARLSRSIMLASATTTLTLADLRGIVEETYDWPIGPHFTVEQFADGSTTITITQGDK
ncbi:hypothetical protein ACQR3W_21840 [Rhodococcus ruber]|uniref:Uncharacterized protein n=1 Tax=Rhodococcus ruber TaxID=1830 RepID=A0A098BJS4_9NOCA|nr:hypothetical protein [Rhodococcus ruber]MCZ4533341.1 hypothetical protein [Rhodococcus ruber]MCZ4533408.1 hypothetical protein [Rhodococcus ruber]CDZ89004.1 hypothetical protein RHRU231_450171 [Rhodococcus ruber]